MLEQVFANKNPDAAAVAMAISSALRGGRENEWITVSAFSFEASCFAPSADPVPGFQSASGLRFKPINAQPYGLAKSLV